MKSTAQDGRHGCSSRGPSSADTFTSRLTGVDGTRLAKCTKSMMNRRGPVIGRMLPFGSCIHAPRRDGSFRPDHDPRTAVPRGLGSAQERETNGNRRWWEAEGREMSGSEGPLPRPRSARIGENSGSPRGGSACNNRNELPVSGKERGGWPGMSELDQPLVFVHLLPDLIPPGALKGGVAVVVDVLRATTMMVHALAAGCVAVIPCGEIDEARRVAASLPEGQV